jgi:hypothetical protein
MQKLCLLLTIVAFVLSLAGPAAATPIVYTSYTTASGSLDGEDFANQFLQLTWYGDTSNVTGGPPLFQNAAPAGSVMITIPSLGVDFLKDQVNVYDAQNTTAAGWFDNGVHSTVLATFNGAFGSYDLMSNIAKAGSSFVSGFSFPTLGGDLVITSADSSTFRAQTYNAVPEPGSLALIGSGLLGVVAYARRRFIG